ncbi:hypothetical protein [Caballeronia sp. KNU42]
MSTEITPTPRFFWIGETSEVFAATSIEQLTAATECGTGIERFTDDFDYTGVRVMKLFDESGDEMDWGEFPADHAVSFNVIDEDERKTGEVFEGTLAAVFARWPSKSLPEMLMTGYA